MGANVDPKPAVLAQFGVLGSVYARLLHGKARPKVGPAVERLRGAQGHAADARRAPAAGARRRRGDADFSYVGYVEGRDIFRGEVDVVVTDGFTGNVVLKCVEGAAEAIMAMVREEVMRSGIARQAGRRADDRRRCAGSSGAPTTPSTAARRCWASTASR